MTFKDLPARQKNEAPATQKQVEFILHLAPELEATAVAKLGKWQASEFIDTTLRERNAAPWFDDDDDQPGELKTQRSCLKTTAKVFLTLFAFSLFATIFFPDKPATSPPPSKQPRPIPTGQSTEAAKQRAIAKYPALAVANSPLNAEFVAQVKLAQTERPQIFDDPEWPSLLAQKAQANLQRVRTDDSR